MPKGIYLHKRFKTNPKICLICKISFNRKSKESRTQWDKKRFCSTSCSTTFTSTGRVPWNKGKKLSEEHREKCSLARLGKKHSKQTLLLYKETRKNEKNSMWKGDKVGYRGLHYWVERNLGKPKICSKCQDTNKSVYHWANVSGLYKRDIVDWIRLCVKCHKSYDNVR